MKTVRNSAARLLTSAVLLWLPGCAQNAIVAPVTEKVRFSRGGVFYTLPRTVLNLQLEAMEKAKKAGKHAFYTPVFFPGKNFIAVDENTYDLGTPAIVAAGEADPKPSRTYFAEIRGNPFITSTFSVTTNQGILTEGLSEVENKTVDFIVSTIEAGAKVASKAIGAPASVVPGLDDRQIRYLQGALLYNEHANERGKSIIPANADELKKVVPELITATGGAAGTEIAPENAAAQPGNPGPAPAPLSDLAKMVERSKGWLTFRAEFDPAEKDFLELDRLSKERRQIFKGDKVPDGAIYSAQIKEMDKLIEEVGSRFFGSEKETKKTMSFVVRPTAFPTHRA